MNSFLFCFLVHVFNKILEQSSILYMVIQNQNTDLSYGCQKISAFGNFLSDLCTDSAYHQFFQSTVSLVGEPSSNADKDITTKVFIFKLLITLCLCYLRSLQNARTLLSWIW